MRTSGCAHTVVLEQEIYQQKEKDKPGLWPGCLCWLGETEDFVARGRIVATRRIQPGRGGAWELLGDRRRLLEWLHKHNNPSPIAAALLEHEKELTPEYWLGGQLVFNFTFAARPDNLHPDDETAHFNFPGMAGEDIVRKHAIPALRRVAEATGTNLIAAYRIFDHALTHHCEPDGKTTVRQFFDEHWEAAIAFSVHCLSVWRYRDGKDAFADWWDSEFEPRDSEPAEMKDEDWEQEEAEAAGSEVHVSFTEPERREGIVTEQVSTKIEECRPEE